MYLYPTKKHERCQYDAAENIDDKQKKYGAHRVIAMVKAWCKQCTNGAVAMYEVCYKQ